MQSAPDHAEDETVYSTTKTVESGNRQNTEVNEYSRCININTMTSGTIQLKQGSSIIDRLTHKSSNMNMRGKERPTVIG